MSLAIHLHFQKNDFLLDNTDHLNFKLEIDAKNPSKEKNNKFLNPQIQFMTHLMK